MCVRENQSKCLIPSLHFYDEKTLLGHDSGSTASGCTSYYTKIIISLNKSATISTTINWESLVNFSWKVTCDTDVPLHPWMILWFSLFEHEAVEQNWSKAEILKKLRSFLSFLRFPVQAFFHLACMPTFLTQQLHKFKWIYIFSESKPFCFLFL